MNLYKRGNVWWVRFVVDGRRYRMSTRTTDKEAAKDWMNRIDVARKLPTFEDAVEVLRIFYRRQDGSILKLCDAWGSYLSLASATGRAHVSEKTIGIRRNAVARFVEWAGRHRPDVKTVEAVTGPVAAKYATYLATVMNLKAKTRINIIADLSTVWKTLAGAAEGIVNPWPALRPQDVDGERGHAFTRDDERRVLDAARRVGKDWFEVCTVMRHTGLRYGDVATMTWDEIEREEEGITIRLRPNKTRRHRIDVVFPAIGPVRDVIAGRERSGDFLFPLHAELYAHKGDKSRLLPFAEVLNAAGLKDAGYTIHSWRHTAATRLAEAGADIETRKRILGHTVDATAERYDHADHAEEIRSALEMAAG